MHMLIAGTSYFPQYTAGTEVYIKLLATQLQKTGHNATVACGGDCTIPLADSQKWGTETLTVEGVDVFRVVRNPAMAEISDHYGRTDKARHAVWIEIFERVKPDVVMVVGRSPAVMGDVEVIAKSRGVPVIWTLIHPDQVCPKGPRINWKGEGCMEAVTESRCSDCILRSLGAPWLVSTISRFLRPARLDRFLSENRVSTCLKIPSLVGAYRDRWHEIQASVDVFVAHSEAARQLLLENGIGDPKILFSPPGFDSSDARIHRPSPATTPTNPVRFGFVGRLCAQKGVETLIDSWRKINATLDCELHFWGDPRYGDVSSVEAVKQIAQDDCRVRLRGGFSRQELSSVYGSMDVLVVPSEWFDNCPFVISEAFLFGVPVIGADFGGISTMIQDGHNGWLFPMKDSSRLASIIERLTNSPHRIRAVAANVQPPREFVDHAAEVIKEASELVAMADCR
ncbi:MAG: glycosyltransferase [Planctomycetaceae bacterium]|nr:glycosyltransferase [Planctomycetaceae bacterium]